MSANNCVDDLCQQALGFVTCSVTGGKQLVLEGEPLADSYFAVGKTEESTVIVPCPPGTKKGATLTVNSNLAVPVPSTWNPAQMGLFPALCLLFLENLQLADIERLSELKDKTVVVIGGLGPAGSLALQLVAAAGVLILLLQVSVLVQVLALELLLVPGPAARSSCRCT